MKVFLDTNIVVDSLLPRKNSPNVEKILQMSDYEDLHFYISCASAATVIYVVRKDYTQDEAKKRLLYLCERIDILSMSGNDAIVVLRANYPDFEDGMQILCAEEKGCDAIITADKSHFKGFTEIPVFTPEEFLDACMAE